MKTSFQVIGKKAIIAALPVCLLVVACGPGASRREAESKEYVLSDSIAKALDPVTTDKITTEARVFLRTADIRCSVKDVRQATADIERIVRKQNGFITYTNLSGTKVNEGAVQITSDSLVQISTVSVVNEITLRVPNEKLDSTLMEINGLVDFLDNRLIKADDVKLQILSAQLSTKRNDTHIKKMNAAIEQQGKKLPETMEALENLAQEKSTNDMQTINLLSLNDQVNYSTVKLSIYQDEKKEYRKMALVPFIEPYTPSFTDKLQVASLKGLEVLQTIALFFVAIWPFFLLGGLVYYLVKFINRKKLFSKIA